MLERLRSHTVEIKTIEDNALDIPGRYEKLIGAMRSEQAAGA